MHSASIGKIAAGVAAIAAVAIVAAFVSGVFSPGFNDGGVNVNGTPCEGIAAARAAVDAELDQRKTSAQEALNSEMEAASDAFWAENRRLEDAHHACMTEAALADPCKELFERASSLAQQILDGVTNGQPFDEAKFQEREGVKAEYDKCVEKAQNDDFYQADTAKCDADLAAGQAANQTARQAAETNAQAKHDAAVASAESAAQQKHGILNAIEEECNKPAGNTNIGIGGITSGSTGTAVRPSNVACTGNFSGNDSELEANLRLLESQLQKARAAGLREGLYGSDHLQQAVDEARQALRESERTCTTDADCGDPEPVCCSGTSVGRVFCSDGACANEVTECEDPEICAGKPAMCVSPTTGAQSQAIEISATIPEVGTCSQNLQVLNLQQASPDSVRYEITGNIPSWVHIDRPGGSLPASVNVTYSCNTVQGFGPGTYTANGTITVFNGANELINTIPINITVTVTPAEAQEDLISVIEYNGKYIPTGQLYRFSGPECDGQEHWHVTGGVATATDGTKIPDPNPNGCGIGPTSAFPVMTIPASMLQIEVRGLEGLRTN